MHLNARRDTSKFWATGLVSVVWVCFFSCSNIFQSQANTTTDQALIEDANKAMNSLAYDQVISDITLLNQTYPAYTSNPDTLMLLASAYAGKCGFNFANFLNTVTTTNSGALTMLQWLMDMWVNVTTTRAYCRLAEDTVKQISPTVTGRSAAQSLFMVLLGLAKIGIWERELFDTGNTAAVDNAFTATVAAPKPFCSSANVSDADISDIGAGLGIVMANLANVGAQLSGASLSAVTTFCAQPSLPANFCTIESEATFAASSTLINAVRTMLNMNTAGLIGLTNGQPCP